MKIEAMTVAILAGGMATRLGAIASRIPKSLVQVGGEPFISHQLRLLQKNGVRSVVLCVGHLGGMIESAVGDGSAWEMRVRYSLDGPVPLGTGGALSKALPLLGDAWFVLYGDSYLAVDYAAVADAFERSGMPALMTIYENRGAWDRSNVAFDGDRITTYDKHGAASDLRFIDYGLGIFTAGALAGRSGAFDLSEVQMELVSQGKMAGYVAADRFYEIGSPAGLRELESLLTTNA